MAKYEVARLHEIDEITDGRQPWRPVRHHLGITAFGATAWTGREAGDRIINEHDEADDDQEELYVVQRGRAVFELDGERARLWKLAVAAFPPYEESQAKTTRRIPLFVAEPSGVPSSK